MEAVIDERLEQIRADLTRRAFLYDDPTVFREAIDLAIGAIRTVIRATDHQRAEVV